MAEFQNDEQRQTYIAALRKERDGYEARIAQAKVPPGNKDAAARYADRIKQVDAELKRVGADDTDTDAA